MRSSRIADLVKRYGKGPLAVIGSLTFVISLVIQAGDVRAQATAADQLQNITPEQAQQLFGLQGGGAPSFQGSAVIPESTILEPTAPAARSLRPSRLEQILSARAGVILTQFGYDELGVGRPVSLPQMGAVQDDYILGPGDEVVVTLRGQENAEYRVSIDRDGRVVLPRLNPVPAAGRSLADLRQSLTDEVHRAYPSTEGSVSIGRLRQISVEVAGEVGSPGVRTLTGLSTPIDAILVSGGIKKTGSLRDVLLIRHGHTTTIDFYSLLTAGVSHGERVLADGDRILVPPLTKVVAAAGWFRRPAIYELAPGQSEVSVQGLETLAGGLEVRGQYRLAITRIESSGRTQLMTVTAGTNFVRDGEVLLALPRADQTVGRAVLAGGTVLAGGYAINEGAHLSDLLKAPGALGTSPYTVFGIISRRDSRTYLRSLIAFSPVAILAGVEDIPLRDDDIVRVFSMGEANLLSRSVTQYERKKEHAEEAVRNPYLATSDEERMPENGAIGPSANGQTVNQFGQAVGRDTEQSNSKQNSAPNDQVTAAGSVPSENARSLAVSRTSVLGSNEQFFAPSGSTSSQAAVAANGETEADQGLSGPGEPTARMQNRMSNEPLESRTSGVSEPPNFQQEVASAGTVSQNTEAGSLNDIASQLRTDIPMLINFLEDHEVTLDGAVRRPGAFVIGPGVNLHDLVMVAGGTAGWADESGVELITTDVDKAAGSATTARRTLPLNDSNLANYEIKPHDELRFRQVFSDIGLGSVTLEGEVRFPGEYKILRGERLADLLKRAGGLTDVAYPFGTVYLRRSTAALEEESFRRTADQIENQLILAMSRTSASPKLDPAAFTATQGFIQALRNQKGLGRVSIVAEPAILAAQPEQNTLLEGGDVVYIPQRPSTVSVLGEVLQPGSFVYRPNLSAEDYLSKAGGSTAYADESLTFIVLPDGSAEKLDKPWLPFDSQRLPPGSTIIVPRDIAPLQWSDIITNATQIFSQMAIAGASLAVISSNVK